MVQRIVAGEFILNHKQAGFAFAGQVNQVAVRDVLDFAVRPNELFDIEVNPPWAE